MTRIKTGPTRRIRHKKVLKSTRGFRMTKSRLYRAAKEASLHAGAYSYRGRKEKKRSFRRLWITRISAALSQIEDAPKYSRFIKNLADKKIILNRKILAYLAVKEPKIFASLVSKASK